MKNMSIETKNNLISKAKITEKILGNQINGMFERENCVFEIGIVKDIFKHPKFKKTGLSKTAVRYFLMFKTKKPEYHKSVIRNDYRLKIDGSTGSKITERQKEYSRKILEMLSNNKKKSAGKKKWSTGSKPIEKKQSTAKKIEPKKNEPLPSTDIFGRPRLGVRKQR